MSKTTINNAVAGKHLAKIVAIRGEELYVNVGPIGDIALIAAFVMNKKNGWRMGTRIVTGDEAARYIAENAANYIGGVI